MSPENEEKLKGMKIGEHIAVDFPLGVSLIDWLDEMYLVQGLSFVLRTNDAAFFRKHRYNNGDYHQSPGREEPKTTHLMDILGEVKSHA